MFLFPVFVLAMCWCFLHGFWWSLYQNSHSVPAASEAKSWSLKGKGDEKSLLYHHPVTFLLVNSSALLRVGVQCGSLLLGTTSFCHVERSDADHFPMCLKYQDISPQVSLPEQAGRGACYIPSGSDPCLLLLCQLHHKYGHTYRWLAVPLQCGTFSMYAGVVREISDSALSCC